MHSETQRKEHSLWVERAMFSSQMSLGRFPSYSELDQSSGLSPQLGYSGVSQICSSSEMLWFANQVFPIISDLPLHLHSTLLPDSGHLVCFATQSGRKATESAHSPSIRKGGEKCTPYFKMSFSPCSQASLTKQAPGLPGNQAASRSYI